MNRAFVYGLMAITILGALSACGRGRVRARGQGRAHVRVQSPPPPTASASVRVGGTQMQAGVTIVEASCDPNAPEICNGLDDNCNGIIDEGCGYSTGNIQITLAWNTGADLDLYVTDPEGFTINYQQRQSPSGGELDQDARGACRRGQQNSTIENVYWDESPPPGQYQVEVHYWGDCGVAGRTDATVSIAVGGQVIGAYSISLQPRERRPVAYFTI